MRSRYSNDFKKKFGIPKKFKSDKEEITFWRNIDGNTKIIMMGELRKEYLLKKYGYLPRIEKVIKIRKLRKRKSK